MYKRITFDIVNVLFEFVKCNKINVGFNLYLRIRGEQRIDHEIRIYYRNFDAIINESVAKTELKCISMHIKMV